MAKTVVTVVGIGRVGLPFALWLSRVGYEVHGLDANKEYVERIKKGEAPFVEEGLEEFLKVHLKKDFFPTLDPACVKKSKFVVLTLGTPVDEHLNPSYREIDTALEALLPYFGKGQCLILRSTLAPGSTERIAHLLKAKLDLEPGKDFFIAFCPERISEGAALKETPLLPQIVGGLDPKSTQVAEGFFKKLNSLIHLTDSRSAELAKLFSNMYRYINFAIANEFMMLADSFDRNIYEITKLVNEGYPRGGLAKPGFAAGPCLYKDGFFLLDKLSFPELISTSWRINETIPNYLLTKLSAQTKLSGKTVAVLGLSFKKNIDDKRNSLSYKLKRLLFNEGANVVVHDPYLAKGPLPKICKSADIVIIAINHDFYAKVGFEKFTAMLKPNALVCDLWNVFGQNQLLFRPHEKELAKPRKKDSRKEATLELH